MIRLDFENIDALKTMHYDAVESYVKDVMSDKEREAFYLHVTDLSGFENCPKMFDKESECYDWLKQFILADLQTLADWVKNCKDKLKFLEMRELYLSRFSNGTGNYVDKEGSYNAYKLIEEMGIDVCPYCEHEFLDVVEIDGKKKRTLEFDHFYPKGKEEYPGLAMCFYNLIPSCKPCNQVKKTNPVAANPYDPCIENQTWLYPNLPIGINMETVDEKDCGILFHEKDGMKVNVNTLALVTRYSHLKPEVHQLLSKKQKYTQEKLEELERMGYGTVEALKKEHFGNPRDIGKGKELHTKMKQDLIGW